MGGARVSEFFYKGSKSKKIQGGGGRRGASVSELFYIEPRSKKNCGGWGKCLE